jgi:hypothetical protein
MPRFSTVPREEVERHFKASELEPLEPIIVDDVLVAVKWGRYRISPDRGGKSLVVTLEQKADPS